MRKRFLWVALLLLPQLQGMAWGFWAHQRINRFAVYLLPEEMHPLFRVHIGFLETHAVDPDKRRYLSADEAPRHYIDLDNYGAYPFYALPRNWKDAVEQFGEDSLKGHGIVPWQIEWSCHRLTRAFESRDASSILRAAADLGHYIGDACVPLHTTSNYNGQLTQQHGIHGFWESRLPELFGEEFDYVNQEAGYLKNIGATAWQTVMESHLLTETVLKNERTLRKSFPEDAQYAIENKGGINKSVPSEAFSRKYLESMQGMVEKRLLRAIQLVASAWYTCWVNAGSPELHAEGIVIAPDEDLERADQRKNSGMVPFGPAHPNHGDD